MCASEPSSRALCRTVEIDKSASHTPRPLQNPNCMVGSTLLPLTNLLRNLESNLSKTFDKTRVIETDLYSGDEDGLSPLDDVAISPVL